MKCISRVPQVTLLCGQNSPCTGNTGLDRGRFVPDVTPRIEDTGLLRPCDSFPRMLFLHLLFMGLVSQGHCLQLPSLGKSAQVPHPRQPLPSAGRASLSSVKKQPTSVSLCLWSPWDETTAGTLALESPVSPLGQVLVPWQAPLHEGRTWSGGFGILWLLSCPQGDPHWPSLSVPGSRAAVEARRPLLDLPVME